MNARAERTAPRKPGRPATYVFNKPDSELSEAERKLKLSIEKRRLRQNRSYHRRKALRAAAQKASEDATAGTSTSSVPALHLDTNERTVPNLDPAAALRMAQIQEQANQASLISGMKGSTDLASVGAMSSSNRGRVEELDAASLAVRWKLPTPSSCVPLVPVGPSRTTDDNAVAPAGPLNLANPTSLIGASLVPDVDEILEDDDHETEALVQNALAAANGSKPQVGQLRDAMDQQRDLLRLTGIKEIVFENLRTQFLGMPMVVQAALQHLVVFPSSFDARAAVYVAGSDPFGVNEMLQNLVGSNFVNPVGKGRFQLNETVKVFMREDQAIQSLDSTKSYQTALTRFRAYFRNQLEQFQGEHIHKVGWQREKAMLVYDSERKNMQFSEFLSQHNSREMLRDFLAAGITVMRYCVSANEREAILIKALEDEEVSTQESVVLNGGETFLFNQDDPEVEAARSRDLANKARLQLALSEAYFDQLKLQEAEKALLKALTLMGGDDENGTDSTYYAMGGAGNGGKGRVVDSVLVLLLLSNVRMSKRRIREARTLCVKALRILAAAGLGRSTFGINAMANLTVIYLEEKQLDKASVVATRLVDTLNNMGYTKMPIFADALGVVGKVSMAQGRYHDAEQQFGAAIEIVKLWASKEWTARPVFHCLDLDLWLLESLAAAIAKQGRTHEASLLETQAQQTRKDRGLSSDVTSCSMIQDDLLSFTEARRSMRHLY